MCACVIALNKYRKSYITQSIVAYIVLTIHDEPVKVIAFALEGIVQV